MDEDPEFLLGPYVRIRQVGGEGGRLGWTKGSHDMFLREEPHHTDGRRRDAATQVTCADRFTYIFILHRKQHAAESLVQKFQ